MSTFWINKDQLDDEQGAAVEDVPEDASFLLTGPAGSGKTNILLLRAKYFAYKKMSDFRIIVFTGSLRKFVVAGCEYYGIDPAVALTQMTFFKTLLDEYSVPFELTKNFETDRNMLAGKVMSLIDEKKISDNYCTALLVDEVQDYTDTELLVFRKLTKRLILATDSRQSIYRVTHTPGLPEKLVGNNVVTLRFHYRSGLRLCKVADAILADSSNFAQVQGECRYPETTRPSSVVRVACDTFDQQLEKIIENLRRQVDLYPDERIGVLFPKREQVVEFLAKMEAAGVEDVEDMIRVDTLHGAKGWEFRAVHIGGCELLYKMGATQKRLIYTGVLRGKTSAHIYYSGHMPGYLEAALAVLEPPRKNPKLDDLFGAT